jgi:hypothetical protein
MIDNRQILQLSRLGYYEVLLTHAGQMSVPTEDCLFLDWDLTTFDPDLPARSVSYSFARRENRCIKVDYKPFQTNVRLSHPVKLSSKARLSSTVTVSNYNVITNTDLTEAELRIANYEQPDGFNYFTLNREVFVGDGVAEYVYNATQTADDLLTIKTINKLPVSQAYTYLLDGPTIDNYNQRQTYQALSKLYQSDTRDGLVPGSSIATDMGHKNPANVAWALLYACSTRADLYVLLILRGLVEEAFRRGYLTRIAEGDIQINPNAYWGFEDSFLPGALQDDSIRDIGDNALLGWAVCSAIRYLQDRRPLDSNLITGKYRDFDKALTQFALSLGYLCAYAISPIVWWSCARFESGSFNYEAVSLKASYLSDIFLNELLQIKYDTFIHTQAARLHEAISYAPEETKDPYYNSFIDYSHNSSQVYRLYWSWKFDDIILDIELSKYIPDATYLDSYVGYLYMVEDLPLPTWLNDLADQRAEVLNATDITAARSLNTKSFLPLLLGMSLYNAKSPTNFYYYCHEATAKVTYVLNELRRMWPVGYQWTNTEVLNTVTSVLGSMLYAEASLYYDYYLLYFLIRDGLALDKAQGDQARNWVSLFIQSKSLTSDQFITTWTYEYLNRDINQHDDLQAFLRQQFAYESLTITHPTPADYSTLDNFDLIEDDFFNYTSESNNYEDEVFSEAENRSIVYKPGSAVDLSADYGIDTNERVNAYGDFVQRRVPGFPYRNCLISFNIFNCSDSLLLNTEYYDMPVTERLMYRPYLSISDPDAPDCSHDYWYNPDLYILDGPVMLKRLHDYIPKTTIILNDQLVPHLDTVLYNTMPAGVGYRVVANNYYIEVKDKIVTDTWFFDDYDRLENTVYT